MVFSGSNSKFSQWMANGLLSTIAWFVVLIIYCVFRAFGIQDPLLGQAFLLLTGAWVGNLTLAQGKKTAKQEETREEAVHEVERKVDRLAENAETSRRRADDSERREGEWSKHKDHRDRAEAEE